MNKTTDALFSLGIDGRETTHNTNATPPPYRIYLPLTNKNNDNDDNHNNSNNNFTDISFAVVTTFVETTAIFVCLFVLL